jgi:FAD/FMN-containing dehydrogenase
MRNITIVDDGQAVIIEGGVRTGDLLPYLWSRGKQTMTTACDCVGFIAPVLGGGHGWLQGRYGLATDQLLSARLVLANGTVVEVSQETNPDLFWALRGAGHNFGLVTQAKLKIYDVASDERQWIGSGFTFTHDKLEDLFDIGNKVLEDPERSAGLSYYFVFGFNSEVDPVNVSLFCHLANERTVAHEPSLSSHSGS